VPDPGQATAVVVSAVDGMAGIGKTALMVYAAHRMVDRFPDGQLFIDLCGYTEGLEPIEPAEALDRLLRDLGMPPPLGQQTSALTQTTSMGLGPSGRAWSGTTLRHLETVKPRSRPGKRLFTAVTHVIAAARAGDHHQHPQAHSSHRERLAQPFRGQTASDPEPQRQRGRTFCVLQQLPRQTRATPATATGTRVRRTVACPHVCVSRRAGLAEQRFEDRLASTWQ
jgi:hypothetical protein